MSRSVESYAHKAAKDIVVKWLRDAAKRAGEDSYVRFDGIVWRRNRDAPHYGVWTEYPVMDNGSGILPVWDEIDDRWDDRPPTFRELASCGQPPGAILDIAIQHKGSIQFGIEIHHKHAVSQGKVDFLRRSDLGRLIELPASWVLGQVRVPNRIPLEFWRIGSPVVRSVPA